MQSIIFEVCFFVLRHDCEHGEVMNIGRIRCVFNDAQVSKLP